MILVTLIWIVGLAIAGYLAYHKREGWGWILFILACSGGDFGISDEKAFKREISLLKKEIVLLQSEISASEEGESVKIVPKETSLKAEQKERW